MTTLTTANEDQLWNAFQNRDREFDGKYFVGVVSTGVYCRFSCKCRPPLRKNVQFFATIAAAENAGLRPCKRCRPNEIALEVQHAEHIRLLAEYISAHCDEPLPLRQLAERACLSPFHLLRTFKQSMGVTPRQFAEACRVEKFKSELRTDTSVTSAIYSAGFGSSSRVYEKAGTHLGMTPAQYRTGGRQTTISYATTSSPLGRMMIAATDRGICSVQFGDSDDELLDLLGHEFSAAHIQPMPDSSATQFQAWMDALNNHLAGDSPDLHLPLDLRATAFQLKVWRYLQTIPYGSVQSYSEVAAAIGKPKAARPVATACGRNRIALAIPCHRVISGTGDLAGYKWGLARKRHLIDQERRHAAR